MNTKMYDLSFKILEDKINEYHDENNITKFNILNNIFNVLIFILYVIFFIIILIVIFIVHIIVNGSIEIFDAITKIPTEKLQEKFNCQYDLNDCDSLINHVCETKNYNYLTHNINNILFNLPNVDIIEVSYLFKQKNYKNFKISKQDFHILLNKYNKKNDIENFFQNTTNNDFNINMFFFHGIVSNCLTFVNTIDNFIHFFETYDYSNKDEINDNEYIDININLNFYSCDIPGFYGKNEINVDEMNKYEILSFYNYIAKKFILDKSNKNDINNVFGFSASGFTLSYIYTLFDKKLIDTNIDYEKYLNNFNNFKNCKINNLYLLNAPSLYNNNGINSILNGIIFSYVIPYSYQFYNTKLGKYLSKFYNFLFFKDLKKLGQQMFFQYFFHKKFNYYNPYKIINKFIDFNYLYSSWSISSVANIETIINNTYLTTCYGRKDTFINFESSNNIEKYIDNNFIHLKQKYQNFIFNETHIPPHSNEFCNLIINDTFRDIILNQNNNNNNIFNKFYKNNEPISISYYNPIMQLISMKKYDKFFDNNKLVTKKFNL
jgi:hypothetical protein